MRISGLTNQEYVTLIGHYNQVGDKSLESQLISRNYTPEAIKRVLSKHKSAPKTKVRSLNVEFQTDNPLNFEGFSYFYTLYRQYSKNGVMPFAGCMSDQPAKVIDIFEVFEQLEGEVETKQLKEINKKRG
jgi:hypothetical protein